MFNEGTQAYVEKKQKTNEVNDQYLSIMDAIEERENKVISASATQARDVSEIKLSAENQAKLDARQKQLDELVQGLKKDLETNETDKAMDSLQSDTDKFLEEIDDLLKGFK